MLNEALLQIIHNEASYCFGSSSTKLCVTRTGGMMAPVTFFADTDNPVEPYYVNPWSEEGCSPDIPSLLAVLRGDFFCAPFGGNDDPYEGAAYPPHGATANLPWTIGELRMDDNGAALRINQEQPLGGEVEKWLAVLEDQSVVYSRNRMMGMKGPMCVGHHPNLFIPDSAGQGYMSHAPHRFAHVYTEPVEVPEERGYSYLKPNTPIEDFHAVPTITGETTDLTRYPNRRGFEDIVMLSTREDLDIGWTAFSLPSLGYVWFSLKDPKVLASSLVWMSNGGRHFPPWNSRNINTIGLEEITAYFHEGHASSAVPNFVNEQGIPTCVQLREDMPTDVNFIQGVVRTDLDFKRVASIETVDENTVRLVSEEGKSVETNVDWGFLKSGVLKDFIE